MVAKEIISIPAPVRGATENMQTLQIAQQFLSTLPMWGAAQK